MSKYLVILFLFLGTFLYSQSRYENLFYDFTLTIGQTTTDSIRVPWHLVVAAVAIPDITNATTIGMQVSFDATTPTTWYDVLELDLSTAYAPPAVDNSITVFNPVNIAFFQGQDAGSTTSWKWRWVKLKAPATEAGTITYKAIFRYY